MYFGAIEPYHKSTAISIDPGMGPTNWAGAFGAAGTLGITPPAGGYVKADETYYYNTLGHMAINMLVISYGSPSLASINNRPGAPKGRMSGIAATASTIMFVGESTWDYDTGNAVNLGNGAVWPSYPNAACWSSTADGWTRYVYNGKKGPGNAYIGAMNRAQLNPSLQGLAVFAYCDGHVKTMRYTQAERCEPVPGGSTWTYNGNGGTLATYYPNWTPEIE